MDILLIESDARRRVSTARHLASARHRVTMSSSVEEAQEILRFVRSRDGGPDAVVIAEDLASADCGGFREDLAHRFPETSWVPLRPDLSLTWLETWMTKVATWKPSPISNVIPFPGLFARGRSRSAARALAG